MAIMLFRREVSELKFQDFCLYQRISRKTANKTMSTKKPPMIMTLSILTEGGATAPTSVGIGVPNGDGVAVVAIWVV